MKNIWSTKYSSVGGKANQEEVFYLIKEDGIWKIDELLVTDEEVEGRKNMQRILSFVHL